MSALGYYLESEGIPTVQISLVREHTEALAPPRALWVPFMLGRPFGVPGDAGFQRRVLLAALQLLEREAGPLIEDFIEDAPHEEVGGPPEGLACPVSFPRPASDGTAEDRFAAEVSQLTAWHDVALRYRGRTMTGLTGLAPDALFRYLVDWLGSSPPAPFRDGFTPGQALKLATDEMKAFYYEAKAVQPGSHSAGEINDWFWLHTAAGEVFLALREMARQSTDVTLKGLATGSLVPRAADAALDASARGRA